MAKLGAAGGGVRTRRKRDAARRNGKLGGRPRKRTENDPAKEDATVETNDEEEGPAQDYPTPYHDYYLKTGDDGFVSGTARTNDNRDQGTPNEYAEYSVRYSSRASALHLTGGTHVGFSGIRVNVWLDGELVDKEGNLMEGEPVRKEKL